MSINYRVSSRKFLLSDAIVLVAATGVALAMVRPYYRFQIGIAWHLFDGAPWYTRWVNAPVAYILVAMPFMTAWGLAIFGLRLRKPRARRRRLVRQPGLVAGLATASVVGFRLLGYATMSLRLMGSRQIMVSFPTSMAGGGLGFGNGRPPGLPPFGPSHAMNSMAMIGVAVAASWLLLAMSGRWRAEPSWIDRAGQAIGVYWIAILPLTGWWDFHTWY